MAIGHVVLYRLRENVPEETYKAFDAAVAEFPQKYPGILHQWQSFNKPYDKDPYNGFYGPKGWDYIISMVFATQEDLDAFAVHPDHIKMSDVHSEAVCNRKDDLMTFDWVDNDRGQLSQFKA